MELKTARLTLLIDPAKKSAFEQLCARQDRTPSQVVRQLIRDYLSQHGVAFQPSGTVPADAPKAASGGATAGRAKSKSPGTAKAQGKASATAPAKAIGIGKVARRAPR